MKYYIDFEATQFSEEIISVGCVREDEETFYMLVAPSEGKITPFITNLTGITKEMLEVAATPDAVFEAFYDWVFTKDNLPEFYVWGDSDVGFIQHTFKKTISLKARIALGYMAGGIHNAEKKFHKDIKVDSCALIKAYNTLIDPTYEQNHNALDDAMMLYKVCKYQYSISIEELREKMKDYVAERAANNAKKQQSNIKKQQQPIVQKWNSMGFASGTVCTVNKKGAVISSFSSLEEAAQWIIDTKANFGPLGTKERIMTKIKNSYTYGKPYFTLNWRHVA